ncbi:MAG: Hsp20/alpha crystallin family protein [Hyphomicrobiales bacterium]|nr:Hsp20/alpha crystallin family protein [Hyphomicrobiales bacterium]
MKAESEFFPEYMRQDWPFPAMSSSFFGSALERPFREMRDFMEAAFTRMPFMVGTGEAPTPGGGISALGAFDLRADIEETDDGMEITIELPGLDTQDVDVAVKGRMLVVTGKKTRERKTKEKQFERVERRYGEFKRVFAMPDTVDEEKVVAKMERGVLKVTVPKLASAKEETRKIKIQG